MPPTLALSVLLLAAMAGHSSGTWCVCKDGVGDTTLQKALDYACGAGADCNPIRQNAACFLPNTVRAHCSYAVNSYFQKKGQTQGSCDFGGVATISTTDPSASGCSYPSTAGGGGGSTPVTMTPTPPGATTVPGMTSPVARSPPTTTTTNPLPNTASPTGVLGGAGTGVSPTGAGKNVVTETGAGQWGCSLAFACSLFGIGCEVWQVRASYDQKPYRRMMMETWGAKVHPSPSNVTDSGRKFLQVDPSSPGSLGIAISEAVEVAALNADTKYCLGSVLNHVLLHQTVIGEECLKQMEALGETPDVIIGCTGGGSNFAGLSFPFLREKLAGKISPVIRAVEPAACPSLTKGVYAYDYGDTAGMTPLMKMHTLGHNFIPDPIHAGGLRYHGMAPLISHVYNLGLLEAVSLPQTECFQGAIQFARSEGLIPAPEPTHAIAETIREALRCRETGESKVILTAMCGHGHFDLAAYEKYLQGGMTDLSFAEEKIKESLTTIPQLG